MRADVVAEDREGRPILVAEVKDRVLSRGETARAIDWLKDQAREDISFLMLVDLASIRIIPVAHGEPMSVQTELSTADVLKHYDPDFETRKIYHFYLETLVVSWLRDLAFRWKHQDPPGFDSLAATGLAARLEGGDAHEEVTLDAYPLP